MTLILLCIFHYRRWMPLPLIFDWFITGQSRWYIYFARYARWCHIFERFQRHWNILSARSMKPTFWAWLADIAAYASSIRPANYFPSGSLRVLTLPPRLPLNFGHDSFSIQWWALCARSVIVDLSDGFIHFRFIDSFGSWRCRYASRQQPSYYRPVMTRALTMKRAPEETPASEYTWSRNIRPGSMAATPRRGQLIHSHRARRRSHTRTSLSLSTHALPGRIWRHTIWPGWHASELRWPIAIFTLAFYLVPRFRYVKAELSMSRVSIIYCCWARSRRPCRRAKTFLHFYFTITSALYSHNAAQYFSLLCAWRFTTGTHVPLLRYLPLLLIFHLTYISWYKFRQLFNDRSIYRATYIHYLLMLAAELISHFAHSALIQAS